MGGPEVPVHVFVVGGEVGAACAGRAGDFGVVGDEVFPWVLCQLGASRGRGRRNGKERTYLYPSRILKGFVFLEVHFG